MSGPMGKVEKVVFDALTSRGMSDAEARLYITKLKNSASFKGQADIELSTDGRLVALSPAIAVGMSAKAMLVEWRGQSFWIPLNQVDPSSEVMGKDDTGILIISKWIAEKKGLVDSSGRVIQAP